MVRAASLRDYVWKLSKPAGLWLLSEQSILHFHTMDIDRYTGWAVEARVIWSGQATYKTWFYTLPQFYLSRGTFPLKISLMTEYWRGTRKGHRLRREQLVTEMLLERQHPRDPWDKAIFQLPDHLSILLTQNKLNSTAWCAKWKRENSWAQEKAEAERLAGDKLGDGYAGS